jgi:hypothetical protein
MAKRITRAQIAKAKSKGELPTTGNGRDSGQKPKLSETNLKQPGFIARLIRRSTDGGRHS